MTRCAADSEGSPNLDNTKYGWEIKGSQPEPFPTHCLAGVAPASTKVACSYKFQPSCATIPMDSHVLCNGNVEDS